MGMMIEGKWVDDEPPETGASGEFKRIASVLRDKISNDASARFPAEAGRYHLYVGYHCPWAHRTIMFRALKGLENAITISYCLPYLGDKGWIYALDPDCPDCTLDQINGFEH